MWHRKKNNEKQCCDGGPAKSEAEGNYHGGLARLNVRSAQPHSGSRQSARGLTLSNYSVKHFAKKTMLMTYTRVFFIPNVLVTAFDYFHSSLSNRAAVGRRFEVYHSDSPRLPGSVFYWTQIGGNAGQNSSSARVIRPRTRAHLEG